MRDDVRQAQLRRCKDRPPTKRSGRQIRGDRFSTMSTLYDVKSSTLNALCPSCSSTRQLEPAASTQPEFESPRLYRALNIERLRASSAAKLSALDSRSAASELAKRAR